MKPSQLITAKIFFCLILLIVFSCSRAPSADTLFINGHIVTMNTTLPEAEAFAVKDGIIIAVGTTEELQKKYRNVPTEDMQGKTVMPGIIDSHGHIMSLGESFLKLNLEGIKTPAEAVQRVKERVKQTASGEWIIGWGWDEGAWAKNYPSNNELNAVSPDNPVWLTGLHGFASWANNKALEIAGITKDTPNPPNGQIIKQPKTGEPTGIFTNEAQGLIAKYIPPLSLEQIEKAYLLAFNECLKNGITTVHDANVSQKMLDALRSLEAKKQLSIRVYVMLDATDKQLIEPFFKNGPIIDPEHWLTIRTVKVFVDGALGSRGAALFEPYSDAPNTSGVITTSPEELYDITAKSLKAGMQVAVHAIGDRANRITLDVFEKALKTAQTGANNRLRIEHAQVMALEDIPRFAQLGIIASMQPPHCTSDMPWVEDRIGKERAKGAYAWRSFLNVGVRLILNSDFPGETLNPFYGMYAAETRETPEGKPEGGWYPEQRLTRNEVVRAYTVEGAYAGFEETFKGQIVPGMVADFIILSDNILSVPSKTLLLITVEKTYVGGKLMYKQDTK